MKAKVEVVEVEKKIKVKAVVNQVEKIKIVVNQVVKVKVVGVIIIIMKKI